MVEEGGYADVVALFRCDDKGKGTSGAVGYPTLVCFNALLMLKLLLLLLNSLDCVGHAEARGRKREREKRVRGKKAMIERG